MARTKFTAMTMRTVQSSPKHFYQLMKRVSSSDSLKSVSMDLNRSYSYASSHASNNATSQEVFDDNEFYRMDFSCPFCNHSSYLIGEHFGDNRFMITYDYKPAGFATEKTSASIEYTQSMLTTTLVPNIEPSTPLEEEKPQDIKNYASLHTPPTKTSAEMFSEYSKNPRNNIKVAHRECKPKRRLYDLYGRDDDKSDINNKEEERTAHHQRFSTRTRKMTRRYIEEE